MQQVFLQPAGQDDNLGDSALRAGLMESLRSPRRQFHILLESQSSDYVGGLPIRGSDVVYDDRLAWMRAIKSADRPAYFLNAGEINPSPHSRYPHPRRVAEMSAARARGGIVVAAGIGVKSPELARQVTFDPEMRENSLVSWRDRGSRDAAGFGGVAPDWAFGLGTSVEGWRAPEDRTDIAVSLRFDRPWPDPAWFEAVRGLAQRTGKRVVTVAQVSRDMPRAVQLAEALGGKYLCPPSTHHRDIDQSVRSIYAGSFAVVSDRAHALIMGATEGAYPLGTAADPQKIDRILAAAGVNHLTGHHDGFELRATLLEREMHKLPFEISKARAAIAHLASKIDSVLAG